MQPNIGTGLGWMAWTWQTALFFGVIALLLVLMTVLEIRRPGGGERRGVLGLVTTRGDRLFISLLVILGCSILLGAKFDDWGWRIPFLISIFLLGISVYIRLQLQSPVFKKMKAEGKGSKAPLTESFLRWGNLKIVLLALFGGVAGQAVVWYTGMFYELFFLTQTDSVDSMGISPGVVIDYATNGDIVGIDIDNASTKLDLKELVLKSIPVDTQTIAA